jgi:hypothetical protein
MSSKSRWAPTDWSTFFGPLHTLFSDQAEIDARIVHMVLMVAENAVNDTEAGRRDSIIGFVDQYALFLERRKSPKLRVIHGGRQ